MGAIPKSPAGTGTTGSPMSPTTPTIAVTCHRILMCWRLLPQRRFLCGQHRFGGGAGNQVNYRNLYREIPDAVQVKAETRRSGAAREVSFDGAEVGFRVDSDRGLVGLDDRDRDPVLEESQLLELLGELERRGWQEVEGLERGAPVGVEADVPEASNASSVAVVRDRVLREVERPAVGGADHLVHVRVVRLVAQHLAGQPRGRQARGNQTEGGEGRAHGNVRRVRKSAARASPSAPAAGANGRITGWVRPARATAAMRSRQCASGPTTPRPSRKRGETCRTAPARSPPLQAAFTAAPSSSNPTHGKKLA